MNNPEHISIIIKRVINNLGGNMLLEDADELIKAIQTNNHYKPNSWETDFLKNIKEIIRSGIKLTPTQSHKLAQIYRQCYGG